jgi:hypothetical protein
LKIYSHVFNNCGILLFLKNDNGKAAAKINYEKSVKINRKTKREILVDVHLLEEKVFAQLALTLLNSN